MFLIQEFYESGGNASYYLKARELCYWLNNLNTDFRIRDLSEYDVVYSFCTSQSFVEIKRVS